MKSLLTDRQAFATPLLLYAYKLFGDDLFELEPETIEYGLSKGVGKLPQYTLNKINAALGLLSTNLFWQDPITFGITCRTLNRVARVGAAPPDLDDIMWGITEARLITGNPQAEPEPFSDSIVAYIQHLLKLDRIVTDIPTLDFIKQGPEESNNITDSDYQLDSYNTSKERAADLEQGVATKMVTMLKQIKDLHLDISKEAAADIENLLQGK